ncbi:MAG: L-threonylcarbamoyladenylate synthase [Scrofimicrobium sp.]
MGLVNPQMTDSFGRAVKRGELVVLPTDTVYGIGADPWNAGAVTALLLAKSRDEAMPPPVLVPSVESLLELGHFESAEHRNTALLIAREFWPGALTLVVKAAGEFGWDMSRKGDTVALRMPNHPAALELLRATGPLAVTSANRTGQAPAESVLQARGIFGDEVSVYVDGGPSQIGVPSTIVDVTGEEMQVLREGTVGLDQLRAVAKEG